MHTPESERATWRASSYSGNGGNCVEVNWRGDAVLLRDTKNRAAGVLSLNPSAWSALLHAQRTS